MSECCPFSNLLWFNVFQGSFTVLFSDRPDDDDDDDDAAAAEPKDRDVTP